MKFKQISYIAMLLGLTLTLANCGRTEFSEAQGQELNNGDSSLEETALLGDEASQKTAGNQPDMVCESMKVLAFNGPVQILDVNLRKIAPSKFMIGFALSNVLLGKHQEIASAALVGRYAVGNESVILGRNEQTKFRLYDIGVAGPRRANAKVALSTIDSNGKVISYSGWATCK